MSQTSVQSPGSVLPEVLLLSESESLASLEKRALRDAGVAHIHSLTSGITAARMLAGLVPGTQPLLNCIVVCGQKLADMDGEQFCALVRLHPRLLGLPILLILANDSELEQLRTLGCGASSLLARPYTVPNLHAHLVALATNKPAMDDLQQATQQASVQNFDKALATYGTLLKPRRQPDDYFRVGMQCLQQNSWNTAITAFQRALQSQLIKGEAEMGIAAAWKGKGDMPRFHAWLARAADTFVRAERWNAARAAFGRLSQDNPNAKNPFVRRAREQIQAGQFDDAADTLVQGYEVTPREQVSRSWARLCMAASNPQAMLHKLEACLEGHPGVAHDQMGEAIRAQVDMLVKQQAAHRREESARRQAELARHLGVGIVHDDVEVNPDLRGKGSDAPGRSMQTGQTAQSIQAATLRQPRMDFFADDFTDFHTPRGAAAPVLVESASDGMGDGNGLLHDIFSVMKLTWRLSRQK